MRCRGADSRAQRRTCSSYKLPLKWKTPPICHCEAPTGPWQSRAGTCSPYKPPLKRYAPIASVAAFPERHAGWQSLRYAFCGARPPDLSLRGGRRPTWESRGTCPDHKKPRRKRKTFYRDIFRQNVFDISAASGYNKDVETRTVATIIKHLSGL